MATETIKTEMWSNYPVDVVRQSLPNYLAGGSNALAGLGVSFRSMGPVTPNAVTAYLNAQGEDVTAVFELAPTPNGTKITGNYTVPAMNWLERKIINKIFSAKQGEIERDFTNFVRRQVEASGPGTELAG